MSSIYGATYPTRSVSASTLGTTTISRKMLGTIVSNTKSGPDVYSPSKAIAACSTYTIPRQYTGLSPAVNLQQTTASSTSAAYFRTTSLQICPTCNNLR